MSGRPPGNARIWIVAFAEGFSTLAVEVIAIRLAIPIVGSSMTLTGVMLGVVLFALSAGYWHGGELSSKWDAARTKSALTRNLLLAAVIYAVIAFPWEAALLGKLLDIGFGLSLAIGVAATLLLAAPVYLVGQSVPFLAELTNVEGKAGKASGKVLFCSTLGSVAGGIVTPIYLFPVFGVRVSTYVVSGLLFGASALMATHSVARLKIAAAAAIVIALAHGESFLSRPAHELYSFDSAHQNIRIAELPSAAGRLERVMFLNGGRASGIFADNGATSFQYILEADLALGETRSSRVLVVGAAGFTFPRDAAATDFVEQIDTVDVDPSVRDIAAQRFLQQPLSPKIQFFPISARNALHRFRREGRRYGFTLLDAYSGMGIPDELLTSEFFGDVHAVSEHTGANVILDRDLETDFAQRVLATFRGVFGRVWVKDVRPGDSYVTNFLVSDFPLPGSTEWTGAAAVYTDDRNTADRDHVEMMWD